MCEDRIMKSTKHCIKKRTGGRENGNIMERQVWSYHNDPPHILLIYTDSKYSK
jgi:hypothetical protein